MSVPYHHLPGLAPFPYGAVYFRKSNPPREDWARDYARAAADGMTTFRHWVLWSAIEVAPGEHDWEDYDRQLDLAAQHGIKTICAEFISAAPEWAWRRLDHARYEARDGARAHSTYSASCATGGFPGLCLDNDDARELAGAFLTRLAERYRGHPGLAGYDVWNEANVNPLYCYCPATATAFRAWLRERYPSPRALGEAWRRYSIAEWEDAQPPRSLGPNPDVLDWLQFRIDNAYRLMRWRIETLRAADPAARIVSHGLARTIEHHAPGACDEWRAAAEVEAWGYTWGSSRHGDEPWKQWHAVDVVRAGARGKPFWHAESYAGPLWMQPQVIGRPREQGRIASPADARLWAMQSYAAGARGQMYLRWRPLLDGPLFGAFGPYALDGSPTPRSEMVARIGKWAAAPEQADLWASRPIAGDLGIVFAPESQLFCYAQQGSTDYYAQSADGAYQGFFENNVQPDWVRVDHIDGHRVLYLPFPTHLSGATGARLRGWVEAGGTLIAEGCPGYWGDRGRVGTRQPNLGLDELFGAREAYVEFTPDLLSELDIDWRGARVPAGVFLQSYEPVGGQAVARYADGAAGPSAGAVAAVEHRLGAGRTLLFGSFPGYGHFHRPSQGSRAFFADLIAWAGVDQHARVRSTAPLEAGRWWGPTARLSQGPAGRYLWITNPSHRDLEVEVELAERWRPGGEVSPRWGATASRVDGRRLTVPVPARDAAVLQLG
jgi:beta-galactosidase